MRQSRPSATGSCRPAPDLRRPRPRSRRDRARRPARWRSRPGRPARRCRRGLCGELGPIEPRAIVADHRRACRRGQSRARRGRARSRAPCARYSCQEQVCQMPRSFSRIAGRVAIVAALRRSSCGRASRSREIAAPVNGRCGVARIAAEIGVDHRRVALHLARACLRRSCGRDRARRPGRRCPSPPPCRARSGRRSCPTPG